jgi:hypothetical protein
MKNFKFLTGDVNWKDYGGKWYREALPGIYHVIELTDMPDACGWDATCTYDVMLKVVDLHEVNGKMIEDAFRSYGIDREALADAHSDSPEWWQVRDQLVLVEAMCGHGLYAPMGSWDGNAYKPLLAAARQRSHELEDEDTYEEAMERPVNRIGSTAFECMRGDMISAIARGLEPGRPRNQEARIMAKMMGAKEADLPPKEDRP